MAFENKALLNAAILMVVKSNTLEEVYDALVVMAGADGNQYPSFEDFKKGINKSRDRNQ